MSDIDHTSIESPATPDWHAIVKYKADGKTEIVPITSIKNKKKVNGITKRSPFTPTSKLDFKFGRLYAVWTCLGVPDQVSDYYNAYIGRIEG